MLLIIFPYTKFFQHEKSRILILAILAIVTASCNRVQPNYEGVLMKSYGRNGRSDFSVVTGAQGMLAPGSTLYQVPMFEQKADPEPVEVTAKDAGVFTVDPSLTYKAIRGKGADIIFAYKHVGVGDSDEMMDNIEVSILNALVTNAYREEARNFTTDSLMNNLNAFERVVEARLKKEFEAKYFMLTNLTSGLKPPKSMAGAIERRNNAKQQAEEVRNQLEVSRMNLEKAKIDAEANRIKAAGLEPRVLQEKWIEAIRTSKNRIIITDGKAPVMLGM